MLNRFEPSEKLDINSNNILPILSNLFNLEGCTNIELFQLRLDRFKQELLAGGAVIYKFNYNNKSLPSDTRVSLNIVSEIRTAEEEHMLWRVASFFRRYNYLVEFCSSNYYNINLFDKTNGMKYDSTQSVRFYSDGIKTVLSDTFNGCRYIWMFPKSLEDDHVFLICINNSFSTEL